MTNWAVIENKISAIKRYLKILARYKRYSKEAIAKNLDLRGAVERYLYLVCQATIDLAGAVIADKNFRKPTTMSEGFHILNEEGIIAKRLTEKMVQMTGFRNILAHDYERVDYNILYDILHKRLRDIEEFIRKVATLK